MTIAKQLQWALAGAALIFAIGCSSDAGHCCPPAGATLLSGCMPLGGYTVGPCRVTCDLWCATNFRIETDDHACAVLRYDVRAPLPGENLMCLPSPDAGADASDGAADASAPDGT